MIGKIVVSLVSILLLVGVVVGVVVVMQNNREEQPLHSTNASSMKMVTSICEFTDYKQSCTTSLDHVAKNSSATPTDYILAVIEATLKEVNKSIEATGKVVVDENKDRYNHDAVEDCKALLEYADDMLQASISVINGGNSSTLEEYHHDLHSWTTAVYSLQTTCTDQILKPEIKSAVQNGMVNASELAHNAVNIVAELPALLKLFNVKLAQGSEGDADSSSHRRLLSDGYPSWFGAADRKLLARQSAGGIKPNVVVAKDGSGQYKTVTGALSAYPKDKKFNGRFVIYVKAGVYDEQVIVDKKKPNVFIYGDGIGRTIITGRKNFAIMNIGTMRTATFANAAAGFIARGITFRNEAGPKGHQAVAFRSQGDRAALFDCSFEGSQDTLYYQSLRQFYKNCNIYGTVDFIFGKGDAIIQDSEIVVRKPKLNQFNTVTADGKEIARGSNGLVIQNCKIVPDKYLWPMRFRIETYLGRPWTAQALTVVMQSMLGDFVRPEGWKIWDGESYEKTCQYYEHANRGPGAKTNLRSKAFKKWRLLGPREAAQYTVGQFLDGRRWLPQTGVPFRVGL